MLLHDGKLYYLREVVHDDDNPHFAGRLDAGVGRLQELVTFGGSRQRKLKSSKDSF